MLPIVLAAIGVLIFAAGVSLLLHSRKPKEAEPVDIAELAPPLDSNDRDAVMTELAEYDVIDDVIDDVIEFGPAADAMVIDLVEEEAKSRKQHAVVEAAIVTESAIDIIRIDIESDDEPMRHHHEHIHRQVHHHHH